MKTSAATSTSRTPVRNLAKGREALRTQAWAAAYSVLSAADREAPLAAEDLLGLSIASHLTGRDGESIEILSRAHQGFLVEGNPLRAARCAFWLAYIAMFNGEMAQSSGWLARCRRLLDGQEECVEHGYLLLPAAIQAVREGDAGIAQEAFIQAAVIGGRFGDKDLTTLALNGQGRALIRQGEIARGVALLDEAMIAVSTGEASPVVAGGVYCSLLESCRETFDTRRAQEWTAALDSWCVSQPDLVPFRGACLLHRAEILQLRGSWPDALDQAQQACERFLHPTPRAAAGAAFYRVAEIHRLRGEFAEAERAYLRAAQWERRTGPGVALLRLAQGKREAANAAIRNVIDEVHERSERAVALDAYVMIALACKDLRVARSAAKELGEISAQHGAPYLTAMADRATGALFLADGDARAALAALRKSRNTWRELEAPYETACGGVLIARACKALGDDDTARLELARSREVFQKLGAAADLAIVDSLCRRKGSGPAAPLSVRELQVLKLVAAGQTNRRIAEKLNISEKTVARHLSNIFNKLDLSSRTAATAYAFQNGLV
jgi:DNA-binding CsgD family transcriptional regulator